jgi:formamidopyrimidine-DNA glycosylase
MWNTLGMSGWWQIKEEPHNNIKISFKENNKLKIIYFNDPRNFGTFIFETKDNLIKKLEKFGQDMPCGSSNARCAPEIFSNNKDSLDRFTNLVQKKKIPICEILLDQKVACGCGNYLRAEALYLAELNPFTIGKNILNDKI